MTPILDWTCASAIGATFLFLSGGLSKWPTLVKIDFQLRFVEMRGSSFICAVLLFAQYSAQIGEEVK